jgi:hypothetical protein
MRASDSSGRKTAKLKKTHPKSQRKLAFFCCCHATNKTTCRNAPTGGLAKLDRTPVGACHARER